MQRKTIVYIFVVLIFSGCANLASNKNACENASPLVPLPYTFLGNIFQITPCTSIEALRIETGYEISGCKEQVLSNINSVHEDHFCLNRFTKKIGCDETNANNLLALLKKNRDRFNIDSISDRVFVKTTRDLVKQDLNLSVVCGYSK